MITNNKNNNEFDRCKILLENFMKATENSSKRIEALKKAESEKDNELIEIIKESIIQTHEIATELSWKTVRCYALKIEPNGRVAGSTTAIKLALSTGVIKNENLARTLLEAIQHRNISSHEYLLSEGLDDYVEIIINKFNPAFKNLINDLGEA